jgi:hypothetical protein
MIRGAKLQHFFNKLTLLEKNQHFWHTDDADLTDLRRFDRFTRIPVCVNLSNPCRIYSNRQGSGLRDSLECIRVSRQLSIEKHSVGGADYSVQIVKTDLRIAKMYLRIANTYVFRDNSIVARLQKSTCF